MPIFFECDRCTACCRWPGEVRVSAAEISAIARYLQVDEHELIQRYTRLTGVRTGLTLEEKESGECVFLEGADCRINPVKPQQCRDFPNLWNFPGFQKICRAKEKLMTEPEFAQAIARATGRNLEE